MPPEYFMKKLLAFVSLLCFVALPQAALKGPSVSVDSTEFSVGTIEEGQMSSVTHSFRIKNVGDAPLTLERVKPGCGCTGVSYDTVIAPGKEGIVTPTLTLRGITGEFHKVVTVTCTAKNLPSFTLALSGKVLPIVEVSKYFLRLKPDSKGLSLGDVVLKTRKADFVLNEIQFIESAPAGVDWQQEVPLLPRFTVVKAANADAEGYWEYVVNFSLQTDVEARHSGDFIFKTNHPQKDQITVRGLIDQL